MFHVKTLAHLTKNGLYPSVFSIELGSSRPIWKDLVTLGPDLKGLLPSISGLPALTLGSFSICWPSLVAVFPGKSFLKWHLTRRF